jgi:hypothetical protein
VTRLDTREPLAADRWSGREKGERMDRDRYELMRMLEREYYGSRKKDEWEDLKYLGVRIGLVGLLAIVVLSVWGW